MGIGKTGCLVKTNRGRYQNRIMAVQKLEALKREFVNLELKDDEMFQTRTNFFKLKKHFKETSKGAVIRRAIDRLATELIANP